ncbi:histone acetyltransferase HAC1-like protein isoform X3 [Tanacetum coccineum]|uniref:histone acetyltransferase n=1 Tax=Tanacetum coccineum TaxID=301880 RepID=A0ABQ5GMU3_9ASTR
MGYNGHNSASNNISNSQYLGGFSFSEFNQNAYSMAFPTSQDNVQSLHFNQTSLKVNFKYNSEDTHDKYASQRTTTNRGTYLRPRVQMSAPRQQLDQQTRQLPLQLSGQLKGQSNVFKTPQINLWKPVQRQPCVAEESLSLYRKRKHEILDFLGKSWEEGTLFDVLRPFYKLPHLEEYSNISDEDLSAVKTEPLAMFSGTKANIIITEGATGSNEQISKGSEGNGDNTTKDEFNEPLEFHFQDNTTSHGREESSQAGPGVNCDINTNSDGYESIVEPMECMTTHQNASSVDCDMVLAFENTKTQTASFNDNETGPGSGNIKIQSVSSVDCDLVFESKSTEAQTAYYRGSYCIRQRLRLYVLRIRDKVSRSTIKLPNGGSISKAELEKAKNDKELYDKWVQCDRCEKWQHYICGLYNKERDQGEGEYICSKCRLTEIEEKKWAPQTVLAAKDLPRTNLSDHIEQRLVTRMKQEREETAKSKGTELKDVAEAEGLVVRVVLSVDKELEVKQQFRDIFQGKDYPEKLKYRSKRLGGIDVCIFGMYVQEYGSECSGPNNRCVYISYLDSVKYFQPERKTSSGESLRTFVYHEILIGYLEHCKKRGFSTCYIWSCPVVKGQDYIFNCRPETQKTPKEDKLLKWYKLMLTKAAKEGIVVDVNNLHKQFFVPKREENNKITAARLPYFDGAYWLGAAETISKKLAEEESLGKLCRKLPNKRILKALGQDNPTRDVLVMQQGILSNVPRDTTDRECCPNLHVCESCNETKGDTCHYHKLTHPSTEVTLEITKNKEPEKQKVTVNALPVCSCFRVLPLDGDEETKNTCNCISSSENKQKATYNGLGRVGNSYGRRYKVYNHDES